LLKLSTSGIRSRVCCGKLFGKFGKSCADAVQPHIEGLQFDQSLKGFLHGGTF
jgi:hypothetical protein